MLLPSGKFTKGINEETILSLGAATSRPAEQMSYATPVMLIKEVTGNEDFTVGEGIDCYKHPYAIIEVEITGDDSGFDLVPCYLANDEVSYARGEKVTVNEAIDDHPVFIVPTYLTTEFNIMCTNKVGNPTVTIYIVLAN